MISLSLGHRYPPNIAWKRSCRRPTEAYFPNARGRDIGQRVLERVPRWKHINDIQSELIERTSVQHIVVNNS